MEYITVTMYDDEKTNRTISKSLNDYVLSSMKRIETEIIANYFSINSKIKNINLFHTTGYRWCIYGEISYKVKNTKIHYINICWNVSHQLKMGRVTSNTKFKTYINLLERERMLKIKKLELL